MIELKGKYNSAKIFTNNIEETALSQIIELCNQEFTVGSKIRIMPDAHAGTGCTIGTTMTITDKVVPNLVGVDIGCGMEVAIINKHKSEINFDQLDEIIRKHIPHGFSVRSKNQRHPYHTQVDYKNIKAPINIERVMDSMGTLGGGNHFIELNEDETGFVYIVIHSGSRNLGKQIAKYYQNVAYDELMDTKEQRKKIIAELKAEGQVHKIQEELQKIKTPTIKKDLAYLQGESFYNYMNDMKIAQHYASLNRKAMIDEIVTRMGWKIIDSFTTIHNYIDMEYMILRKGAISAQEGERVIIPINMKDGSIIAYGKGNPDWNFSGPHGAGRIMSRTKAKETLKVEEFVEVMKDVWTTSVSKATIDEAPMVYKPMEEIIENTKDTVEISNIIKPIYNFKAN